MAIWHPYTQFSSQDAGLPCIERGEGVYLYDRDGRRYLDGISSWWCVNLGHSHPRVLEAIRKQSGILQHSILGNLTHPGAKALARELSTLMPGAQRHVMFASDGSSANEAALKIAVQYFHNIGQPERTRFVALSDPYHGDTLGSVSVGYMPAFHRPLKPLLFEVTQVPAPATQAWDEADFAPMQAAIDQHGKTLAGVIVEPLCQGASGMRMYAPEFLARTAALCKVQGIPLIVDEIAMGLGRTGSMWAFEQAGISPDIVTVGKGLSAGYLPIAATVVKDEIYRTFSDRPIDRTFYHGHTFAGNPMAAAAALETLAIYREENIVAQVGQKAQRLKEGLLPLASHPGVKEVRCLGMIGAVELDGPERAQKVQALLLDQDLLLRPLGPVIYLMLPLVTPDEIIRHCTGLLTEALASS